jgi:hypothetical protein
VSAQDEVAAQLVDELGPVAEAVAAVFGVDLHEQVLIRLDGACQRLAGELCCDDDRIAAGAVLTLMAARWPDGTAVPPEWWRTAAGRMVARSIGADDAEAVTHSVAAAMLGVTRGAVGQMVSRGASGRGGSGGLERHPDGGITRSSVLARIARER